MKGFLTLLIFLMIFLYTMMFFGKILCYIEEHSGLSQKIRSILGISSIIIAFIISSFLYHLIFPKVKHNNTNNAVDTVSIDRVTNDNKKEFKDKNEECPLNNKLYDLPENATCSNSGGNAWQCNSGYEEIDGNCYLSHRDSNGKCSIKGNISFESKRKIYHLPGSEFYNQTVINAKYGERYFCTEYSAQKTGWVKSEGSYSPYLNEILKNQSNYNTDYYSDDEYNSMQDEIIEYVPDDKEPDYEYYDYSDYGDRY